jgi:hypothetical protein
VRLALKGNPSILALLFVSDGLIRTKDRFGDELRFRSSFFVSKRAGHAFLGYLIAQRQRLMHERGGKHGARTNEFQPLDLKYAAHMVRLGLQGIELMNTGHISIPMDFKKGSQIRAIRNGSMTEQEIMEIGGNLEQELRDAIDVSTFPDEPMKEEAEAWMLKVYQQSWHYVSAGVFCVVIDGNNYFCSGGFQPDALGWNPKASSRPCYDPSVVGKVFTFVPR